jgi:drug/metabolite transporter (DMT)-like permease
LPQQGVGTFSLMDAAMKDLSLSVGAYNAVLWRNLAGTLIAGMLFVATGQGWPARDNLRLHLWRSIIVAGMAVSFFWAIARLPLAEAIGLSFIAPVIALYLAAIMLGEKIGREAILASVAGLAGVGVILYGKFSGHYSSDALWGALAVLFSAVLFAYNLILRKTAGTGSGTDRDRLFPEFVDRVRIGARRSLVSGTIGGGQSSDAADRRIARHIFAAADELGLCAGRGADFDPCRIYRLCLGCAVRLGIFQ